MREDIINIVKILGIGCTEIIIDIEVGGLYIDTIELRDGMVFLHHFKGDLDLEINFDDIEIKHQIEIHHILNSLLYN